MGGGGGGLGGNDEEVQLVTCVLEKGRWGFMPCDWIGRDGRKGSLDERLWVYGISGGYSQLIWLLGYESKVGL